MGPATDGAVGFALLALSHPARQTIATAAVSPEKGLVLDMMESFRHRIDHYCAQLYGAAPQKRGIHSHSRPY
jgi:hypothetical protein